MRQTTPLELGSLRHVLTPPWHLGETRKLLRGSGVRAHALLVDLAPQVVERAQGLPAGRRVGLVLRDAASSAGYRDLLEDLTGVEEQVAVVDQLTLPTVTLHCAGVVASRQGRSALGLPPSFGT